MSRGRRRQRKSEPQTVTIEAMSHEGRGIAHVNGKTVFVFGALEGETVRMQIVKRHRKFDQATTLEVIDASPDRIQPGCEAFEVCGGCSLQHLGNDDQVKRKQDSLKQMMAHAGLQPEQWLTPLRPI